MHAEIADSAGRIGSIRCHLQAVNAMPTVQFRRMPRRCCETPAQALAAELALYQQELASYDAASGELLAMERDRQSADRIAIGEASRSFAAPVGETRRDEAEQQAREARGAAAAADPAIRRLAEQNQKLAEERKQLAGKIDWSPRDRDDRTTPQGRRRSPPQRAGEGEGGRTNQRDGQLRKERTELPDLRQIHEQLAQRQEEIATVQLRLFDLEDRRRQLPT